MIQDGDFASGSCNRPGGKPQNSIFWESDSRYYLYEKCGPVLVSGDRCVDSAQIIEGTKTRLDSQGNIVVVGP